MTDNKKHINMKSTIIYKSIQLLVAATFTLSASAQGVHPHSVKEKQYIGVNKTLTSVVYFDGFGRPTVTATSSATDRNVYMYGLQEYDDVQRIKTVWLPGAGTSPDNFSIHGKEEIKTWSCNSNGGDTKSYATVEYDIRNRTTSTTGAGSSFNSTAVRKYSTNDKFIKVRRYCAPVNGTNLVDSGYYSYNSLYKEQTIDEDKHTVYVFYDKHGRKILERRSNSSDTYFVYNEYGELRFVLSPRYQQDRDLRKYGYEYRYDSKGRCIYKRLPGCEHITYAYDSKGRIATMQDGILRSKGQVRFYLYDHLNRNVMSGIADSFMTIWTDARKTGSGDGLCGTMYRIDNNDGNTSMGNAYIKLENVYYYDDYSFVETFPACFNAGTTDGSHGNTRLTGVMTSVDGGNISGNRYNYRLMEYDEWGNCCRTYSTNTVIINVSATPAPFPPGGTRGMAKAPSMGMINKVSDTYDVKTTTFSYTDKPVMEEIRHYAGLDDSSPKYTEVYTYTYNDSDMLREIKHRLTVAGMAQTASSPVSVAKYSYDHHGRLTSQVFNNSSRLKTSFQYNIRSWLTKAACPLFTETLEYESPTVSGATAMYSGNISAITWRSSTNTAVQSYAYVYDKANRLGGAIHGINGSNVNRYSENATYDINGNILTLKRRGMLDDGSFGMVDNLKMTYNGNQLHGIKDSSPDNPTYKDAFHYSDRPGSGSEPEFEYDANGRMTKNLDRGICRIEYNLLNLPVKITYTDGSYVNFSYDAMGNRVISSTVVNMATSGSASSSVQGGVGQSGLFMGKESNHSYSGNILYQDGEPSKLFFQTGYVDLKDDNKYYFIIKDHLGSVREVADAQGNVVQHNEYYAFGGLISDLCTGAGIQGYRFQGKELEREHGLNWNYHGARYADMLTGGWTTVDPLAESFYNISPYAFCANNTAMYIDPDGMAFWNFFNINENDIHCHFLLPEIVVTANRINAQRYIDYSYFVKYSESGNSSYMNDGDLVEIWGNLPPDYITQGATSGNTGHYYKTGGFRLSQTAVSMAFPGAEAVYEGITKAYKWTPKNDIVKYVRYMVDYHEIDCLIKTYNLDEVVKTTKRINKGFTVVSIIHEYMKDSSSENIKKIAVTTATGMGSQLLFSYVGGFVGGFFGGPIGYAVGYGVGGIIGIGLNYYFSEEVYDKIF